MQWYDIWMLVFAGILVLNIITAIRSFPPVAATVVTIIDLITIYAITRTVTW
jgi:hypothetical protein